MRTIRVIGPGRAGRSLSLALEAAGWAVAPPLGRGDDLSPAAEGVDVLAVCTPDDVVAWVARAVRPSPTAVVLHCSGSLGPGALRPHPRRATLRPLVTLPDPETGARRLASGVTFALDGDPMAREIVTALGGRALSVRPDARGAYHAAACIAADHVVALLGQAERVGATAGLTLDDLLPLATGAVEDAARLRPRGALTGPAARGDWQMPARHPATPDATGRRVLVLRTGAELSAHVEAVRRRGGTVGLVPTMGALHAGHRSLIERAARECDHVAVTVFVNPLQFSDPEDLDRYPRDLEADVAVCAAAGADVVFAPPVGEMYPDWPDAPATVVTVGGPAEGLEGSSRPGHFRGVATVVAKLLSMAGACRAYFGEKDFQQLAVVRRMVSDLSMPVTVVACRTVREPDGLALSSRNARLSGEERHAASVLWRALSAGRAALHAGELRPDALSAVMAGVVVAEPLAELDYAVAVDADTLTEPASLATTRSVRLLVAARVGPVRLIDNCDATPTRGAETGPLVHPRRRRIVEVA